MSQSIRAALVGALIALLAGLGLEVASDGAVAQFLEQLSGEPAVEAPVE